MSLRYRAAACGLVSALLAAGAASEACDSAACSLAARDAARWIAGRDWLVDVSFRYVDQGRGLFRRRPVDDVWHRRVDLARGRLEPFIHRASGGSLSLARIDVGRRLSRRMSIRAGLPLLRRQTIDTLHPSPTRDATRGIGDFQMGADVVVLAAGSRSLTAGMTAKLPTGASGVAGGDGVVDPMLQPGTGSLDGVASLQVTERVAGVSLWSIASFQKTTANARGYRHGDEIVVAVGATRALSAGVTGTVQVKFQNAGRHRFRDANVLGTGSTDVQVIAGAGVPVAGAALYATVQIPAYTRVNESQLAARITMTAGIVKTF